MSDVVVSNFRPGVMARYRLDAETLLAEHPRLIVATSSANGSTGPEAGAPGLASIFGASGGLSEQTGYADGPPTEIGESTDYRSANALAVAILAALVYRHRTGTGQSVDLSSREVVVAHAPDAVLANLFGTPWDARRGNHHDTMVPHDLYPCVGEDEWISIAIGDQREWAALCNVLHRPQWGEELGTPELRGEHRKAIDEVISAWTSIRTPDEAFHLLQEQGVPAAPSFTNRQLAMDAHVAAREVFTEVDHPEIGVHKVMREPWLLSGADCPIRRPGPLRGQDNAFVLENLLGLEPESGAANEAAFR